jgi:hypothetical protein
LWSGEDKGLAKRLAPVSAGAGRTPFNDGDERDHRVGREIKSEPRALVPSRLIGTVSEVFHEPDSVQGLSQGLWLNIVGIGEQRRIV